jgi:hypothetical protein
MAELLKSEIPPAWVGWLAATALMVGLGLILSGRRMALALEHTVNLSPYAVVL